MSQFYYINAKSVQEKKKIVKECIKLAHTLLNSTEHFLCKPYIFIMHNSIYLILVSMYLGIETHQKQKSKFITRKETRQMDRQDETKY